MEGENRRREVKGRGRKLPKDDDDRRKRVAPPQPQDEEVNQFWDRVGKTQQAADFLRRNGVRPTAGDATAASSWIPKFWVEDFDGVNKDPVVKF
ncbi:hypothetical protein OROMI_025278 [Orobanche minor]